MSLIMFSKEDSFFVRKAVFRMILSRAKATLRDPVDIEELDLSELTEGISLFRFGDDQRDRLSKALLSGIENLRADVINGRSTEEPLREGIDDLLAELVEYMNSHFIPNNTDTNSLE